MRSLYLIAMMADDNPERFAALKAASHSEWICRQVISAFSFAACIIVFVLLRKVTRFVTEYDRILGIIAVFQALDCISNFLALDPTSQEWYEPVDKSQIKYRVDTNNFLHYFACPTIEGSILVMGLSVASIILFSVRLPPRMLFPPFIILYSIAGLVLGTYSVLSTHKRQQYSPTRVAEAFSWFRLANFFAQLACFALCFTKVYIIHYRDRSVQIQAMQQVVLRYGLFPFFYCIVNLPYISYNLSPLNDMDDVSVGHHWTPADSLNDVLYYSLAVSFGLFLLGIIACTHPKISKECKKWVMLLQLKQPWTFCVWGIGRPSSGTDPSSPKTGQSDQEDPHFDPKAELESLLEKAITASSPKIPLDFQQSDLWQQSEFKQSQKADTENPLRTSPLPGDVELIHSQQ